MPNGPAAFALARSASGRLNLLPYRAVGAASGSGAGASDAPVGINTPLVAAEASGAARPPRPSMSAVPE
jgi:hypothetical protein